MAREKKPDDRPGLSEEEVRDRIWREPGGDELAFREASTGTDADVDGRSDDVAEETPPDHLRRISDPRIAKKPG